MVAGHPTKTSNNPNGRPSSYSQDLADLICAELAQGKALRTVVKSKGFPSLATVFKWMRENPEFLNQYTRAKEESADAMAEEILALADTTKKGKIVTKKETANGTVVETKSEDMLGHRRLQIETRKWLMTKMKPKKYGDKLDLTSDGKVLPTPILGGMTKHDEVPADNSSQ